MVARMFLPSSLCKLFAFEPKVLEAFPNKAYRSLRYVLTVKGCDFIKKRYGQSCNEKYIADFFFKMWKSLSFLSIKLKLTAYMIPDIYIVNGNEKHQILGWVKEENEQIICREILI